MTSISLESRSTEFKAQAVKRIDKVLGIVQTAEDVEPVVRPTHGAQRAHAELYARRYRIGRRIERVGMASGRCTSGVTR